MIASFPARRQRRLRKSPELRSLVRETTVSAHDLIYPIFVEEDIRDPIAIPSMPGINRVPERSLARELNRIADDGVKAVMLFGISHHKDAAGSDSWMADGTD